MIIYWMCGLTGMAAGFFLSGLVILLSRKQRRNYQKVIDQYLSADKAIHFHIREHVLRERDLSWAVHVPPIVTVGIKEDGTVMSDEEFAEARRMAKQSCSA